MKTCEEPAFLKLIRSLSISSLVISASQTKKGDVVYSGDGSLNCDERVLKSGTLTSFTMVFLHELKITVQVTINIIADCLRILYDFIDNYISDMKTNVILRRIQISL